MRPTQPENEALGYSDTPVLPESGYTVHDGRRPQPPVIQSPAGGVPSDAIVLFGGDSLDAWQQKRDNSDCAWNLVDGEMEVKPGTGDIISRQHFGDCQVHVEFASPKEVLKKGQGRGNSGIFLMGLYEVQVLDNYENPTYPDGTVGGLYGQTPPLVNPMRAPGEWNQFDIFWSAPRFENGSYLLAPRITVMLNGVVLHHAMRLQGPTQHKVLAQVTEHGPTGPLQLQDHGDLVRFRNIWVRELPPILP